MLTHLLFLVQRRSSYSQLEWYEEIYYGILNGNFFEIGKAVLILWFLILILFYRIAKQYHSNWNFLIDDLQFSTQEFYELLKKELHSNNIKSIETYTVSLPEGSIGSPKRRYLEVEWKNYKYHICGAPFGKGFFVSWWLFRTGSVGQIIVSKIPVIGLWLSRQLYRETYYKTDTASMFMTYCHKSVQNVIDSITKEKGLRSMSEDERKPVLKNIFNR